MDIVISIIVTVMIITTIVIMMLFVSGPGLWVLSQLLLILYFWLDNGANTCGIDFHFGEKNLKAKRDLDSIISDDAPRGETYFEFKFFEELLVSGFKVVSEEGR